MSETRTPLRGNMVIRPSRASRCNASRIGVRPILNMADSICSERTSPGLSLRVTICSSINRWACSVSVSRAALRRLPLSVAVCRTPERGCRNAVAGKRPTSHLPSFRNHCSKLFVFRLVHRIGVVVVRERAFLHLFDILHDSADGHFGQFGVALGEFGLE